MINIYLQVFQTRKNTIQYSSTITWDLMTPGKKCFYFLVVYIELKKNIINT